MLKKNLFFGSMILLASVSAHADNPCAPDAQGNTSNAISVNVGSEEEYDWGEAVACVSRPIRETWAVLHNQGLMVWGGVDNSEYGAVKPVPAGYTHFYSVDYHVKAFIMTVSWTMNWLHQVVTGTMAEPKEVKVSYEKVDGTSYIRYWKGYVSLKAISPTLTAVTVHNEVNAERQTAETSGETAHDLLAKLQTGTPNWDPLK